MTLKSCSRVVDGLIKALIATPKWILQHPTSTINVVKWYMPAFVAFALFLYVNGGIVLGTSLASCADEPFESTDGHLKWLVS